MTPQFDVCILGTGAAGLYLAELLSRDQNRKLALVEAGGPALDPQQQPFTVRCLAREHAGVNSARVTAYGGATNTWGGGLIRLAAHDLVAHPGMGYTGWPISYDDLCANYEKVEQELRVFLSRGFLEQKLYPANGAAFRQRLTTILPFWRKNFARTFGRSVLRRPNVSAYFNAGNLLSVANGPGVINALEFSAARRLEAKTFIIAAGVVNSNLIVKRLLAQANRDHDYPAFGRGFHDHLSIPLFIVRPKSRYDFSTRFSYRFARTLMFAEHYETEPKIRESAPSASAFLHFTFDLGKSPALQFLKQTLEALQRSRRGERSVRLLNLRDSPATLAKLASAWAIHRALYIPEDVQITAVLDLEQLPSAEWRFGEMNGTPSVTWDIHPSDLANARYYAGAAEKLLSSLSAETPFAFEALFPSPANDAFDEFVHRRATDTYHASGGLRMGRNPSESVVSEHLALHEFRNVHVVSTAVFPRVGAANPTLTLLALAQRLFGHLTAETSIH